MQKTIRLLILVKNIDGGTGTFLLNFLKINKLFPKYGLLITTLVFEKPQYRNIDYKDFIYYSKSNTFPKKYSYTFKNARNFFDHLQWTVAHINERKPNVVIGIDVYANIILQLAKYFSSWKTKTILTTHIDLKRTLRAKSSFLLFFVLKKIIHVLYNKADLLVCISRELSLSFAKDFNIKKQIQTIFYGGTFPRPSLKKGGAVIISIARLDKQKDHYTLLEAFKIVKTTIPNATLWIVGDGPLKKELHNFVRANKLSQSVVFYGWVKNVYQLLQQSSVFVLSTKREGFSYALLEAISQGLPAIATNAPYGPAEILQNNTYGILVSPKNKVDMAKRITELLSDKKKNMFYSKQAVKRSLYFSLDKMLQSYKAKIEALTN